MYCLNQNCSRLQNVNDWINSESSEVYICKSCMIKIFTPRKEDECDDYKNLFQPNIYSRPPNCS